MSHLLALEAVSAGYDEALVLDRISFHLDEGESLAVLGRNGAGKTTLLMTLMGLTRLQAGTIDWKGADLAVLPTYARARAGLGWVPQGRRVFASLSVEEHLRAVARSGPWTLPDVYQSFPRLHARRRNLGYQLSGGEQQMLAIARALMVNPKLLLLDEAFEGLAPLIIEEVTTVLRRATADHGTAIMLVEQHPQLALSLTQRAIVLNRGQVIHESSSKALLDKPLELTRLLALDPAQ